jgi:hypothetical protein
MFSMNLFLRFRFSILKCTPSNSTKGDPSFTGGNICARYSDHDSLAYGADWCRTGPQTENLPSHGQHLIASCSFYDKSVKLWCWDSTVEMLPAPPGDIPSVLNKPPSPGVKEKASAKVDFNSILCNGSKQTVLESSTRYIFCSSNLTVTIAVYPRPLFSCVMQKEIRDFPMGKQVNSASTLASVRHQAGQVCTFHK